MVGPESAIRYAVGARFLAVDHVLRSWIVGHRVSPLDSVMWGLSAVGRGGLVWIVSATALVAFRRLPVRALISLALALLLAAAAVDRVLKPLVDRQRPFVTAPEVPVIGDRPDDASWPSGHAANAFAGLTTAVIFVSPRNGVVPSLGKVTSLRKFGISSG